MRGVDDLDFFIGDEAIDKPTYATKVKLCQQSACVSAERGMPERNCTCELQNVTSFSCMGDGLS